MEPDEPFYHPGGVPWWASLQRTTTKLELTTTETSNGLVALAKFMSSLIARPMNKCRKVEQKS